MIRPMDPDLVAQIKAGEVIERPASVVKELIENALDAEAARIRIEIVEGGTKLVRVVDDGKGIAPDELALAFEEHTSSKLHSYEEMDSIQTLGFRGEALHAIANVARVEAISSSGAKSPARRVVFDHGRLVNSEPAASGGGTRIAVHDLFANVPARRKHLRSARSESAAIHQVVTQYAVGRAEVAFTLMSDGKPVVASPGTRRIADAFASVYGAHLVDAMVPISEAGPVVVDGLISPLTITRPNRSAILLFVNGRPVRSAALVFAIEDAYSGLLMTGRHPMAVVRVYLPPGEIDPNVHPTKLEVRFLSDRPVFVAVRNAVARGLQGEEHTREPTAALVGQDWASDKAAGVFSMETARVPYPSNVTFEETTPSRSPALVSTSLPSLRVFGQAAQTFIVAEGPSGLYMIDQHAAHERIIFDSLTREKAEGLTQPLLAPFHIELTPEQAERLEAHGDEVRMLGFAIEPFGDRSAAVRGVPTAGGRTVDPEVILEVLDSLGDGRSTDEPMMRGLAVVACKTAVKAGDRLSMVEMRDLVTQLEKTENPRTCPHGRPTTIHLSTERLEREFGRR